VSRGQRNIFPRPYSRFTGPVSLLFLPSSSSIVLTRLSGPSSRPTTSQKILLSPGIVPGTSGSVARNSGGVNSIQPFSRHGHLRHRDIPDQCCPTFLCTRAQFTDAYGGAGATTPLLLLLLLIIIIIM
jgi:hypothetical protein